MIPSNFIYIGVLLQFVGGVNYLIDTIKGNVKPNRVSWLLWTVFPLIVFDAQIKQGVGNEALATFIVGFTTLLIFLASFVNKKSVWKIQKLDIVCGILSVLGIILWMVTKVGNVAIVFSILADSLASIPTIVKSWNSPESESTPVYFLGIINVIIGLLVIKSWNFENYAFLVYILTLNSIFCILIQFKVGKLLHTSRK